MEVQLKGTCERINGVIQVELELGPPFNRKHVVTYNGNTMQGFTDEQLILITAQAYQKALQETFGVSIQAKQL